MTNPWSSSDLFPLPSVGAFKTKLLSLTAALFLVKVHALLVVERLIQCGICWAQVNEGLSWNLRFVKLVYLDRSLWKCFIDRNIYFTKEACSMKWWKNNKKERNKREREKGALELRYVISTSFFKRNSNRLAMAMLEL